MGQIEVLIKGAKHFQHFLCRPVSGTWDSTDQDPVIEILSKTINIYQNVVYIVYSLGMSLLSVFANKTMDLDPKTSFTDPSPNQKSYSDTDLQSCFGLAWREFFSSYTLSYYFFFAFLLFFVRCFVEFHLFLQRAL